MEGAASSRITDLLSKVLPKHYFHQNTSIVGMLLFATHAHSYGSEFLCNLGLKYLMRMCVLEGTDTFDNSRSKTFSLKESLGRENTPNIFARTSTLLAENKKQSTRWQYTARHPKSKDFKKPTTKLCKTSNPNINQKFEGMELNY